MEPEKDRPKVMDVSRAKKPVEQVVPSRPMLSETKKDHDDVPAEGAADKRILTDKHKVIARVDTGLPANDAAPTSAESNSNATDQPESPSGEEKLPTAEVDSVSTEPTADNTAQSPATDTQKAIAEAAKSSARQDEIEKYIDSRQFYVPVDAAIRKKSVKISGLLTVLIFLLACALIDLMIDSGTILLVQKIPHTHFFTTNKN